MKKLTVITMMALALFVTTLSTANAWTMAANPITGIFKAVGATVYHVVETPVLIVAGEKSILEIGDITRGPIEGVEELGAGIAGIETGTITDTGKMNTAIESNPISHAIRNGVGTGLAVSSIVAPSSSALHATQAGWWSGLGIGTITAADDYIH